MLVITTLKAALEAIPQESRNYGPHTCPQCSNPTYQLSADELDALELEQEVAK
jgi:hypothetical protein